MARHKAQQLALPCTLDEAAQLHEEIASLRSHLNQVCEQLAIRSEDAIQAKWEIAALRRQVSQVTTDRDSWRNHYQTNQLLLSLAHAEIKRLSVQGAPPLQLSLQEWVGQELQKLLTVAHPDKWSQGQPATALGHDVAAAINTIRQRLGEW